MKSSISRNNKVTIKDMYNEVCKKTFKIVKRSEFELVFYVHCTAVADSCTIVAI